MFIKFMDSSANTIVLQSSHITSINTTVNNDIEINVVGTPSGCGYTVKGNSLTFDNAVKAWKDSLGILIGNIVEFK